MSLFARIEERASVMGPRDQWERDVFPLTSPTSSGVEVGYDRARMLTAVWSCQSLIADGIASLPVDIVYVDSQGRRERRDAPSWLEQPNLFDKWFTFIHKIMISLIGAGGNAYIRVYRTPLGVPYELHVLDPSECDVDEFSATPIVHYRGGDYDPTEIIHIPGFTIPGKRAGLSMISHAAESIGLGLAVEEYGARFFGQGTTMSGVIEHPGKATPGEVAMISKMMRKTHGGLKNSHAVGVLAGGATFKPISITPNEAQFLETRRFNRIEIAALYRVPPHMIDPSVQSSWGTGIEEQNGWFAEYGLLPWIDRLEEHLKILLLPGESLKWNMDARLRAKMAERFQSYAIGFQNGFLNPDGIREKEDLDPIPGGHGQKFFRPANLIGLDEKTPDPKADPSDGDSDPKAEARHLPGQHDQQDHGNRHGRSWRPGDIRAHRSRTELRIRRVTDDPVEIRDMLDVVASPGHEVHVRGDTSVSFRSDGPLTVQERQRLLWDVEEIQDRFPHDRDHLLISVVPSSEMPLGNESGVSSREMGIVLISEDAWSGPGNPARLMPSRRLTQRRSKYTLAHEYGHILDGTSDARSAELASEIGDAGMSPYGLKSPRERTAEAFAEWYLSKGRTGNEASIRYARELGWPA
ncbi:phage portal protein [Actinoplanes sp. CA-054009]